MNNQTYHIITIGCQMNKADSERLAAYLESLDFKAVDKSNEADLVALVTCGVRQSAEDRIYSLVKQIRKDRPTAKIILTGCLSDRPDVQNRLRDKVDLFFNIKDLPSLKDKLKAFVIARSAATPARIDMRSVSGGWQSRGGQEIATPVSSTGLKAAVARDDILKNRDYLNLTAKYQSAFSAYVPIGNGCNNFCAYCVVPYARGREIYRPHEEAVAEVRRLIAHGYKEIILIAQNVNSYNSPSVIARSEATRQSRGEQEIATLRLHSGQAASTPPRNDKNVDFADLLKMIDELEGDFWIRFATSHPKDLSDKLIKTVAESKKICPHWHIALQSGSDVILKLMNRQYTAEHYKNIVKKIRLSIPKASITTDVIVGFPGETEEQFQQTNNLIKEIGFNQVFISQYSPRPGTASAKMIDDVSVGDKKQREQILDKTLKDGLTIKNKDLIGQEVVILVDKQDRQYAYGRSADFKLIRFATQENFLGQFVTLIISGQKFFSFTGQLKV